MKAAIWLSPGADDEERIARPMRTSMGPPDWVTQVVSKGSMELRKG